MNNSPTDDGDGPSRRQFIAGVGAVGMASLAGCTKNQILSDGQSAVPDDTTFIQRVSTSVTFSKLIVVTLSRDAVYGDDRLDALIFRHHSGGSQRSSIDAGEISHQFRPPSDNLFETHKLDLVRDNDLVAVATITIEGASGGILSYKSTGIDVTMEGSA